MSKQWLDLTDVNGTPAAAARGNSLIRIPTENDLRIHDIHLELTNGAGHLVATDYGEIAVIRNGRQQRFHTITELDEVSTLWGEELGISNNVPGGVVSATLMFSEWFRQQYAAREVKAWDVQRGESLIVNVEHLAVAGTAPNVKAYALVEYGEDIRAMGGVWNPNRPVMTQTRDTFQVNSSKANINNLTKDAPLGNRLGLALFANPTGAIINEAIIRWDGGEFRRTKLRNDYELSRLGINIPDGYFPFVPDMTDNALDMLPVGGRKLEVELRFTDTPGGAETNGTGNVKTILQWEGARA